MIPTIPEALARQVVKSVKDDALALGHPFYEETQKALIERIAAAVREALEEAKKDIHWLLEFVVEPEFFPNQGDRQYWHERVAAIAALREGRDA